MERISYEQIARWSGAEVIGEKTGSVANVVSDSRKAVEDSLFVALCGENFNGNRFVLQALLKGAFCALCSEMPESLPEGKTVFLVKDSLKAYGLLARGYKRQFQSEKSLPVVGITGSVGKTSCKDMVAAALSGRFHEHVLKTKGNLNNIFGVPMTLMTFDSSVQAAVIEMGMNHFDEVDFMASLAEPDIGIVTNVGTAHIENLGSQQGILKAKLEIVPHIQKGGKLFLNGDDELLYSQKDSLSVDTEYFGFKEHNDCRILSAEPEGSDRILVTLLYHGKTMKLVLNTIGRHMAYNAAPAVMAAMALGLSEEEIVDGFAAYEPTGHRLAIVRTPRGIVIDDTYNANPVSMSSALDTLFAREENGRKVAILGDMFELGAYSEEGHALVGRHAASEKGPDVLICVGKASKAMYEAAKQGRKSLECHYFDSLEELKANLLSILKQGDIILLKASHAMGFESLIEILKQ